MPKTYERHCNFCGQYYKGRGKRFCSPDCANAAQRAEHSHTPIIAKPEFFEDWTLPEDVNWREWCASAERQLELTKQHDPTQEYLTIDMSLSEEPIAVAFMGDIHMGGGFTNYEKLRDTVDYILATEGLYLGMCGDSIEGFIPGVKSAETSEQQPLPLKNQIAALRSLVKELSEAEKLLWWTWGDHDAKWLENLIGFNMIKLSIHDKVPYFTGRGIVTLKIGDMKYYIAVNHSERFSSQWNPTHPSVRQYERFFPAHVTLTAHKHKPAVLMYHKYSEMQEAGLGIGGKTYAVVCGTFKTGPDPYTIRRWNKGVVGVPTAVFWPDEMRYHVFESPATAIAAIRGFEEEK